MRSFCLIGILFFFLLTGQTTEAQSFSDSLNAQTQLSQRGEVYFRFPVQIIENQPVVFEFISRFISIDAKKGGFIYAYANATGFRRFLEYGIHHEVLTPPSLLLHTRPWTVSNLKSTNDWNYYPTYPQYVTLMQQFASNYPQLCALDTIGTTTDGRLLLFAHIRSSKSLPKERPSFMYTSTIHGDETVGYVLMLRLIDYLLKNYGVDPTVTDLVDSLDIWINPLANPDGTYASGDASVSGATRYNANGVDLNRNFPDPALGDHPDGHSWQPETKAFMKLAEQHQFVVSANLHTGSEVVNYPWDTWQRRTADDDWWQLVSRQYADTVHTYNSSGYLTNLDNGISDGYDWYRITGGRQDYMNYYRHDREFTLELSAVKMPDPVEMPGFWNSNYRSLLNYMRQALYGFRGEVTDSLSGKPLYARVFILAHDVDNSDVYSDSVSGCYFRPVKGGTYDVTYSADGYVTKTYSGLVARDGHLTVQNVALKPDVNWITGHEKNKPFIYPNPSRGKITLKGITGMSTIKLYSLSGVLILSKNIMEDHSMDLSGLPRGTYIMIIENEGTQRIQKVVLY
ncbi:MAG: T9SS type A sorting domain-containing protein [Bacteroidales bacterium]|nr:T9SS type A sorting domain-containing protein [Bacteroidales bacterium]